MIICIINYLAKNLILVLNLVNCSAIMNKKAMTGAEEAC